MQTNPQEYVQQMNRIIAEVKKAVVGKDVLIAKILLAVLANGNVLMVTCRGLERRLWHWHFPEPFRSPIRECSSRRMYCRLI